MMKHIFLGILAIIVGILAAREAVFGPQQASLLSSYHQTAVVSPIPQLDQMIATK